MSTKPNLNRTPVDQDDLCEIIYHMLWNKNVFYPSSVPPVFVPDTVIFRSGTPIGWYFSDSEGIVKRKKEASLNVQHITDIFLKKKSKYGIVAYYLYLANTEGRSTSEGEEEPEPKTIIEYYDEPGFLKFMANCNKLKKGILQRFIDPQGEQNSLIQCVWTKRIALFNRRINCRLLKDSGANIYEKCVTFEGPAYMSESTPMKGNALGVKVKEALDFIINHIANSTYERYEVSKLVCYFKVDNQSRIWYLYSGFFRVNRKVLDLALKVNRTYGGSTEQIDLNDTFKIPGNIHVGAKMIGAYRKSEETLETCPRCSNIFSSSNFVEVTYQDIMEDAVKAGDVKAKPEEFENTPNVGMLIAPDVAVKEDNQDSFRVRNKQADIPYIIRKVHQRLRSHEFEKVKNEDYFKLKKTRICYNCYFHVSKTNIMSGNDRNPNSIIEKIGNPRPTGQTLTIDKIKKLSEPKQRSGSVSVPPLPRLSARANSVENLERKGNLESFKTERNQSTFENNIVMQSRERAKEKYREEVIRNELNKLKAREEQRKMPATSLAFQALNVETTNLMDMPNIFDNKETGKIVKLTAAPLETRPMVNSVMPGITPISRSSAYSKKSNNYMDALYSIIQNNPSPNTANPDFQKVSFIPEQTEHIDSEEEILNRQLLMAEPIDISKYRKPYVSKIPVKTILEQHQYHKSSLSERVQKNSSQDLLNEISMRRQMIMTGPTEIYQQDNSKNRSTMRSSSVLSIRERDTSLPKDEKTSQFSNGVKSTIKVYLNKVPSNQIPSTKRGFNILKFYNNGNQNLKVRSSNDPKTSAEKKMVHKKHISEIFRPLNKSSTVVGFKNSFPSSEMIKPNVSLPPDVAKEDIQPIPAKKYDTESKITPKSQQEADGINEIISEQEMPVGSRQDCSEQQPTMISNFPTYTNPSLPRLKTNESQQKFRKDTVTKEEKEGLTTDLEYSVTQPLRSTIRKDTYPLDTHKGEFDTNSRHSRSRSPPQDMKPNVDLKSKEPYMGRITNEQFNELTAKPFASRKSTRKNDSNLMLSRHSAFNESQHNNTAKEENLVLAVNAGKEEEDKESGYPSSVMDQKSNISRSSKKSEIVSSPKSKEKVESKNSVSEDIKEGSEKSEQNRDKKSESRSLVSIVGSSEMYLEEKFQESETIRIEDGRKE